MAQGCSPTGHWAKKLSTRGAVLHFLQLQVHFKWFPNKKLKQRFNHSNLDGAGRGQKPRPQTITPGLSMRPPPQQQAQAALLCPILCSPQPHSTCFLVHTLSAAYPLALTQTPTGQTPAPSPLTASRRTRVMPASIWAGLHCLPRVYCKAYNSPCLSPTRPECSHPLPFFNVTTLSLVCYHF